MGTVILGDPCTGKSTILNLLIHAVNKLYKNDHVKGDNKLINIYEEYANPKSVTKDQLFGYVEPISEIWKEGVLSLNLKEMVDNKTPNL